MSEETQQRDRSKLGFLDSLAGLFRGPAKLETPPPEAASRFDSLQADFEAAIRGLHEKLAAGRGQTGSTGARGESQRRTAHDRAAESLRRMEAAHREIREDIEKMHGRLGTKLRSADLDELVGYLRELQTVSNEGKDSHTLIPRARYAITARLWHEAGELAVASLVSRLGREKLDWPDPTRHSPFATPEEIERSRRRRLAEIREAFLAESLEKAADRMLGIVRSWRSDYPDRGSPLWEETVLEGVAAGMRGQLVREFVETLRRNRDQLLVRTEELVGKELGALQKVLQGGITSIDQANQAMASALRVLDEVVPGIAWENVRAQLPEARGEVS
jgi:hypothetical protein